ncbi:hypothetical protein Bbelb_076240 [Branchiostoma belcheri]|nr:hypothetical protein Bbelb_076240 [Branchiostoma belcheri]
MECPDCGETVRAKQKFCHECGAQLQKRQKFQDPGDGGGVVVPTSSTASAVLAGKPAGEPDSSKEGPLDLTGGEGRVSSLSTDHNANMEMPSSHRSTKPMEAEPMETDSVEDVKGASTDDSSSEALKDGKPPDSKPPERSTSSLGEERPLPDDNPPASLPDDKRPVSPTVLADTLQKSVQLESPVQESKGLRGFEKGDVGSLGEKGSKKSRPTEMGQGDNQRGDLEASCPPEPPGEDEQVTKTAAKKSDKDKAKEQQQSDGEQGDALEKVDKHASTEQTNPRSQPRLEALEKNSSEPATKPKTKVPVVEKEILHRPPKDEHSMEANKDRDHNKGQASTEQEKTPVQEEGDEDNSHSPQDMADLPFGGTQSDDLFAKETERDQADAFNNDDQDGGEWQQVKSRKQKKQDHKNRKRRPADDPASPDKTQKDNTNQSARAPYTPSSQQKENKVAESTQSGSSMTIHFHVLVSPDFKMKEEDRVHVRSSIIGFEHSFAILETKGKLKDDYIVAEGKASVSPWKVKNRQIAFKYAVVTGTAKKEVKWEAIHYDLGRGIIANRALVIPLDQCKPRGEVHVYSDVMQVEHGGFWEGVKKFFGKDMEEKMSHDRWLAAKTWLPQWKGICCGHAGQEGLASEALQKVEDICKSLGTCAVCSDLGFFRAKWDIKKFSISQVLLEYIGPKLSELGKVDVQKESTEERKWRVVSALSICWLVARYGLNLDLAQVHNLFQALLIKPDVQNKACHEMEAVELHFCLENKMTEVTNAVVHVMNKAMSASDGVRTSNWMLALPILHFLRKDSAPFEGMTAVSSDRSSNKWWGLSDLNHKGFKSNIKYGAAVKPLEAMKQLNPELFAADVLLERSCAAILRTKELLDCFSAFPFSLATLCAAISANIAVPQALSLDSDIQEFLDLFHHVVAFASSLSENRYVQQPVVMAAASKEQQHSLQSRMLKRVEKATSAVIHWLNKRLFSKISRNAEEETKVSDMDRVELFCSLDMTGFPSALSECFSSAAFDAVDKIVKSNNGQQILNSYSRSSDESKHKYGGLFSRMLCRTWPGNNTENPDDLLLLRHMLRWQPCAGIIKLFGEASDLVTFLDEESQTHIASYKSLLGTAVQELTKGSIIISHLQLLLQHRKQFLELCNAVAVRSTKEEGESKAKKAKGSGKHDANMVVKVGDTAWPVKQLEKVLDWRGKEMEAIKTETRQIECFLSMCEDIKPVACEELEQKVRREKLAMSLNELCQPVAGDDIAKVSFDMNQPPNVTYFGITPEFREMSTLLENLSKSIVFNKIWEKMRPTQAGEEEEALPALTVDGVLGQVWTPAYQKWLELRQNVKDGKITLQDVDETFGQFKNEYRKLEYELKMLAKNPREGWVRDRVLQIEQYHQLNKHLDAADVVKDVKEKYNLKGDFKGVEILLHSKAKNFKQNPLSSINKKVVNAGKLLTEMTEERIESLRKFVKCQRLVDWLRTKIHDTKELKVFVDLASISAGESDIEVDKVNCLLSAGVGYAPLIYDLDEDSDFDTLMKCCRQFWAALEKDKHLPKKLMDTCRNLEWLKGVSDSHGSVEMSSLSQTEAINARGVYEIGCFGQNQSLNDLESVVRLRVEGAESEEFDDEDMAVKELKEYNLSMLKSLQSKLMLLAGKADKGSQEVDRFVEVPFHSVQSIGVVPLSISVAIGPHSCASTMTGG